MHWRVKRKGMWREGAMQNRKGVPDTAAETRAFQLADVPMNVRSRENPHEDSTPCR
jgi:hypothetical protein